MTWVKKVSCAFMSALMIAMWWIPFGCWTRMALS